MDTFININSPRFVCVNFVYPRESRFQPYYTTAATRHDESVPSPTTKSHKNDTGFFVSATQCGNIVKQREYRRSRNFFFLYWSLCGVEEEGKRDMAYVQLNVRYMPRSSTRLPGALKGAKM